MAIVKKALVTGCGGQDGSYMCELLLEKGYIVWGLIRPTMRRSLGVISEKMLTHENFRLMECDITDWYTLQQLFSTIRPDEVYNLAGQSDVGASWQNMMETIQTNAMGALNVFEAARAFAPGAKIYQASSSEMFGNYDGVADENTPLNPRSPYGASKVFAHNMAKVYRESYNMFISCGICFNHESPRRGMQFVTKKIIRSAKRIKEVELGNLKVSRDWGYAPEYMEAAWRILQRKEPDNFIIATGETHQLQEFIDEVKKYCPELKVKVNEKFARPADIFNLRANPKKIKEVIGWEAKVKLPELAKIMWESEE